MSIGSINFNNPNSYQTSSVPTQTQTPAEEPPVQATPEETVDLGGQEPSKEMTFSHKVLRNVAGAIGGTVGAVKGFVAGGIKSSVQNATVSDKASSIMRGIGGVLGTVVGGAAAAIGGGPIGLLGGVMLGSLIGTISGGAGSGGASVINDFASGAAKGAIADAKEGFATGRELVDKLEAKFSK